MSQGLTNKLIKKNIFQITVRFDWKVKFYTNKYNELTKKYIHKDALSRQASNASSIIFSPRCSLLTSCVCLKLKNNSIYRNANRFRKVITLFIQFHLNSSISQIIEYLFVWCMKINSKILYKFSQMINYYHDLWNVCRTLKLTRFHCEYKR